MPLISPTTIKRGEILSLFAVAAMVIWFCDEIIFSGKIPFFRDLVTYFYPIKFSVAEAVKAGALPLWDRHMATGFPIMAGFQSAVFYPPSVAFYLLPFAPAIQLSFVIHYFIAASGGYYLFRYWQYPVHISLIGSILFAFGGTTVSLSNLLNHFQSAVWLPWVIYFWEQTVRTRRWREFVIFTLVALCQLLAGSPEIFVLSMGLVVLDTVRLQRDKPAHGLFRPLAVLLGAGCVIVGLGMVQFLPTAELISQSRRDQSIPASEALGWSLRPSNLLGLLLPTLEADSSLSVGVRLLLTRGVPFLLSPYMGVILVFGLSCWLRSARSQERVIVLTLIGGSLLLACGNHTPVYPFLYEWIAPLRVMRFPEKFYFLTFALLIFSVVRGLRQMDAEDSHWQGRMALVILAAWLIVYVGFRLQPQWLAGLLQSPALHQGMTSSNPQTLAAILVVLEKQVAIALVLAGLFWIYRFGFIRKPLLQFLLVLAVFFDISSANKPLHFLREAAIIEDTPRVMTKSPADRGRLFYYPAGDNLHPSYVRVTGRPDYKKATELSLNNLLPNAGMLYGFEYFQDIDALGRRSYTDFLHVINSLPADRRGALLRATNVKYVVAFHPLEVKGLELLKEFPEHYSKLFTVTDSVPRTYVVGRAIVDRDPRSIMQRLSTEQFDPRQEVIVDRPMPLTPTSGFLGNAEIKNYLNNQVQIDARLSEPGILVLTDAFYPGWKALVDGKEQDILRANYLFRAVALPAGNHKVEFIYDPASFRVGLIISLVTAGFLMTAPLLVYLRRRDSVVGVAGKISDGPALVANEAMRTVGRSQGPSTPGL